VTYFEFIVPSILFTGSLLKFEIIAVNLIIVIETLEREMGKFATLPY